MAEAGAGRIRIFPAPFCLVIHVPHRGPNMHSRFLLLLERVLKAPAALLSSLQILRQRAPLDTTKVLAHPTVFLEFQHDGIAHSRACPRGSVGRRRLGHGAGERQLILPNSSVAFCTAAANDFYPVATKGHSLRAHGSPHRRLGP